MRLTPARVFSYMRHAAAAVGLLAALAAPFAGAGAGTPDLRGRLLVAADTMPDPRFQRTVIYLFDHDAGGGTLGLVVNKPLGDMPLGEFLDSIGVETPSPLGQVKAYYGGPVEPSRAFLLLPPAEATEANDDPAPAVVSSLDSVLSAMADIDRPERSIFVLGYSGWSSGQLEAEITAGNWHIIPFDQGLVFGEGLDQMWNRALTRRAIEL